MPQEDPLTKPITAWTRNDLTALLGREESEYLEVKGSAIDVERDSGKAKVARALAGLTSASGGFVIVGTQDGGDRIESYPGISIADSGVERLRRSLLDRIRPSGFFAGPLLLAADSTDKRVVVLQAFSHPLGLPASANGRFWVRVGNETREISYDDVRRRFLAAGDLTDTTRDRAATILRSVADPMAARYKQLMSAHGHPEIRILPFATACTPLGSPRDLGFSGGDLLAAVNRAAELERSSYSEHIGDGFQLNGSIVIGGRGLYASEDLDREALFTHDGAFGIALGSILEPLSTGSSADPAAIETYAARYMALASLYLRDLVGPLPIFVMMESGSLEGLPVRGAASRNDTVGHEVVLPAGGLEAAETIYNAARLLSTRMANALGRGDSGRHETRLGPFLEAVFR